jgi:NAD(P)H dehydrogenase (quinone)
MVGIPYSGSALGHTVTGGTPYGASHVAGADNNQPISDDEKTLARLLGRRVANTARLLCGNPL